MVLRSQNLGFYTVLSLDITFTACFDLQDLPGLTPLGWTHLTREKTKIRMSITSIFRKWYQTINSKNEIKIRHTVFSKRICWQAREFTNKMRSAKSWENDRVTKMSGTSKNMSKCVMNICIITYM
jgi:hypothetical protein